jgi:catechol 2,3-dioxygenase-like lactoylglutathione lyase family enzyme
VDWKIEVIVVPVSDVERSKAFYSEQVGFVVDVDQRAAQLLAQFRSVLVTVLGNGVRHRGVEHFLRLAGDGEGAVDLAGHRAAVDHLAGHLCVPLVLAGRPVRRPAGGAVAAGGWGAPYRA